MILVPVYGIGFMIRDQGGRWLWSGGYLQELVETEDNHLAIQPEVNEESQTIELNAVGPAGVFGIMPNLTLAANHENLRHRHVEGRVRVRIPDIDANGSLDYFGLPSSDIIISTYPRCNVFPDGDEWLYSREHIPSYGTISEVDVSVWSEPQGRPFYASVEVNFCSYRGEECSWESGPEERNDIQHIMAYLQSDLPWNKFNSEREFNFSHLIQLPGRFKRGMTRIYYHERRNRLVCNFTIGREGHPRNLLLGLMIGNDDQILIFHSNDYRSSDREIRETHTGFLVHAQSAQLADTNRIRAYKGLLHPALFDALIEGRVYRKSIARLSLSHEDQYEVRCQQVHIALGRHEDIDHNSPSDEDVMIDGFRLIADSASVDENLFQEVRIGFVRSDERWRVQVCIPPVGQLSSFVYEMLSATGESLIPIEMDHNRHSWKRVFSTPNILSGHVIAPRNPMRQAGVAGGDGQADWLNEESRYVFVGITKEHGSECLGAIYIQSKTDTGQSQLCHMYLAPIAGATFRFHPSRLHQLLFAQMDVRTREQFLEHGLPLAFYHQHMDIWSLCMGEEGLPVIQHIHQERGVLRTMPLEFDEEDGRWHLEQRGMEGNRIYSWLLGLAEAIE